MIAALYWRGYAAIACEWATRDLNLQAQVANALPQATYSHQWRVRSIKRETISASTFE